MNPLTQDQRRRPRTTAAAVATDDRTAAELFQDDARQAAKAKARARRVRFFAGSAAALAFEAFGLMPHADASKTEPETTATVFVGQAGAEHHAFRTTMRTIRAYPSTKAADTIRQLHPGDTVALTGTMRSQAPLCVVRVFPHAPYRHRDTLPTRFLLTVTEDGDVTSVVATAITTRCL